MSELKNKILREQELLKFKNYEEYIESFITARDLYHLRSKLLSRQIIELGYHTEGTLTRESYYKNVKKVERYVYLIENPYSLCSELIQSKDLLLQELALREKANRMGELYTIIFIRNIRSQSQISGFIDYNHRLKSEDWLPYFKVTKKIKPQKHDLSYYDWKHRILILNKSLNFEPIVDGKNGIVFKNLHDHKYVNVGFRLSSESETIRSSIDSELYGQVVLYDHNIQI